MMKKEKRIKIIFILIAIIILQKRKKKALEAILKEITIIILMNLAILLKANLI